MIKLRTTVLSLAILSILIFFAGCPAAGDRVLVFMVDMSASAEPDARSDAFGAIRNLISGSKLERGDKIVVIPITGDAWADSQGSILRFRVSEKREVYDSDLKQFADQAQLQLEVMERSASERPFQHTDIFGALKLASAELQQEYENTRKTVVILSDMIQDDPTANFNHAKYMENSNIAVTEGGKAAKEQGNRLTDCDVVLGFLRSSDLKKLPPKRREALEAYWEEYFRQNGARSVVSAIDGPGQLDSIISKFEYIEK